MINEAHISLKPAFCMNCGQDFLRLHKSSTYGPLNITKETRFDMEYMPTQTINLTRGFSREGFHVKIKCYLISTFYT